MKLDLEKTIIVAGLGLSGRSAVKLLQRMGAKKVLTLDEKLPADFVGFSDPHLNQVSQFVVSPGVPLNQRFFHEATARQALVTSELAIAATFLTSECVIGITGSLGKSTVTSLIGWGIKTAGDTVFVGGNLGIPLAEYALSVLAGRERAKYVVLELSSYQLENLGDLKLNLGVITYLSPNHLERYDSLEHYYQTKWKLPAITQGPVILNKYGGDLLPFAHRQTGPYKTIVADRGQFSSSKFVISQAKLMGEHNWDNIALAAQAMLQLGYSEAALSGLLTFAGLPHRLENLGEFKGVKFINDSKATAIDSVEQSVQSVLGKANGDIWLLLGGKDKGLPWSKLFLPQSKSMRVVFFGLHGPLIKDQSSLVGPVFPSLGPAVQHCLASARPGDLVLLSPGGTSLDEFKSFEHRGEFFKKLIHEWAESP